MSKHTQGTKPNAWTIDSPLIQHASPFSPNCQSLYLPIFSLQKTGTEQHMQQTYNPSLHYRSLYQLLEKMPKHLRGISSSSSSSSSTTIAWPVLYVTEIFLFHPLQHLGRTRVSGQPEDSHLPEAEAITDGLKLGKKWPSLKGIAEKDRWLNNDKFLQQLWLPRAELHREAGFPSLKTRVSSSYLLLQQEQQQQKH